MYACSTTLVHIMHTTCTYIHACSMWILIVVARTTTTRSILASMHSTYSELEVVYYA